MNEVHKKILETIILLNMTDFTANSENVGDEVWIPKAKVRFDL